LLEPASLDREELALEPAMKTYLDDAIGETRLVRVDDQGRLAALQIERWSERGRAALLGEVYLARVAKVEPRLGGAFVDLGVDPPGFLPFKQGRTPEGLHEGARIKVEVAAEAASGKGPRLRRLPDAAESGAFPRLVSSPAPLAEQIAEVRGPEARRVADQAVDAALAREVPLDGGGSIAVEPTRGLVAIDVDAGARASDTPARLARAINLAAVEVVARHVGLRSLSGVIVVDLMRMSEREDRDLMRERMKAMLATAGVRAEVSGPSRLGLLEIAVERRRRAVHEILLEGSGACMAETTALAALRRLEDEGVADRGARLELLAPGAAFAWLEGEGARIGWREGLTTRLGARFRVSAHASDAIEVRRI
jgi:Ribonuclease G/E